TPPKDKNINIYDFEQILWDYLTFNLPDELNILSTHSRIEEIFEIDLDEIEIKDKSIYVKGDGILSVELQYGSDGDQIRGDGLKMTDTYPFGFELTLEYDSDRKLKIIEVDKLEVDTNSFYK
ncbi:hypothetical protein, partial [Zunongwangia profunda]|uniref:pPIWI-associating nuclease domain-containing protein n=1 Tax=Zunongwangia profunda TaxID=398743 RepID=UPI0030DAA1B2